MFTAWIVFVFLVRASRIDDELLSRAKELEARLVSDQKLLSESPKIDLSKPPILLSDVLSTTTTEILPVSTLRRPVIACYDADGLRIVPPPLGYVLDTPPAEKRVNIENVGLISVPGRLNDETLTRLLRLNFAPTKEYNIFDVLAFEDKAKHTVLDADRALLSEVLRSRSLRRRLALTVDPRHRNETLLLALTPPILILTVTFLLLWIVRGFRRESPPPT